MTRYDHYTDKFINDDLISREESLMCLTGEYLEGQEYKLDDEIHKFMKRIQNIPPVPAIPISVIEQIKAEIKEQIKNHESEGKHTLETCRALFFALEIIDKHIKEYTE